MKQSDAVEVVYSLLPQMKEAAPEQVLTKYAAKRGLSPAQLERLCHVYNTASTLSTLEKDRNASPYLMDAPKVVRGYIETSGSGKRASWFENTPAIEKAAATAEARRHEVPNVWNAPDTLVYKKATAPQDLEPVRKRAFWAASTLAERLVEEEADAVARFSNTLCKLAEDLTRDDDPLVKFAMLSADTRALNSEIESDIVIGKLAATMKGLGVDVINNAKAGPSFVLARDRTGHQNQIREACEHLKIAIDMRSGLTQSLGVMLGAAKTLTEDPQILRQAHKTAKEIDRLGRAGGLFKGADAAPAYETLAPDNYGGKANAYGKEVEDTLGKLYQGDEKTLYRDLIRPGTGMMAYGARAGGEGIRRFAGESIPAFLNEFSPEGTAGKLLKPYGDANQRRADGQTLDRQRVAEDTRAVATLKKIMLRDDILSTKDPQQVFDAFQAIRKASPEVAADEQMLTLLLRQTLATQGLDIDTATAARKFEYGQYRGNMPGQAPQPQRA